MTATSPDDDATTEFVSDEDGVLHTVAEKREMEQDELLLAQAMRDFVQRCDEDRRAAHPAAFSIPQTVYARAGAQGQRQAPTLTPGERNLLLSRGDLQGRALANSASSLARAERYQILGWPDPDVVAQRIRAVTSGQLSTPAELYAKADRSGAAAMTLEELQLAMRQFRQWEGEDENWRPSMFDQLLVPGNHEAYMAALQEEGINWQSLGLIMAEYDARAGATLSSPPGNINQGPPFPTERPGGGTLFQQAQPFRVNVGTPSRVPIEAPPFEVLRASIGLVSQQPLGSGDTLGETRATGPVPDSGQTARVLAEIANALENLRRRHAAHQMDAEEYRIGYDCVVSSLRGFSLRFSSSSQPSQPPPRSLGPNPFGLRLSHDAQRVIAANPHDQGHPSELPLGATQTPPWTIWSVTIPHRMRKPSQIGMAFADYVAAIQAWTEAEEQAWQNEGAPQGTKRFYTTPPTWPFPTSPKHPFNVYYEEVKDSEAARAWPQGDVAYAKKTWEALPAVAQEVYVQRCEDLRKQAWVVSMASEE